MSYRLALLFFCLLIFIEAGCKRDKPITPEPAAPADTSVNVKLSEVPYQKLSDYRFFTGQLQDQNPNSNVLPYKLASSLFTDYALKKRFVWMPAGESATYTADDKILDFPTGAALIKTFYYDQVLPVLNRRILETRVMIMTDTGWLFAEYVWNDAQTDAYLDMNGSNVNISWQDASGAAMNATYRIPSDVECLTCHKLNEVPIPIGPKPQNLNNIYNYPEGGKNQLSKWIELGYLQDNLPAHIVSTVDYNDASQPLQDRVRSLLDISCGHCHQEGSHCSYRPLRLGFSETTNLLNMGVCVLPDEDISDTLKYIIMPGKPNRSVLYYRFKTTEESLRMPLLGRTMVHTEGLALIKQWIETLPPCAP